MLTYPELQVYFISASLKSYGFPRKIKMHAMSYLLLTSFLTIALQFCEAKVGYSYLSKNNGFCASLRLCSKGTFLNEIFSNISSKCSLIVSFCELERSSSSVGDLLGFLMREPIYNPPLSEFPKYIVCLCKILKLVIATEQ